MSPSTNATVAGVCQQARPALASLGELGVPLLEVVAVVERLAGGAAVDRLSDPAFALDVLAGGGEPAVIGRVLDFLRQRAGAASVTAVGVAVVDTAEAVAQYERGARALLARGTQHTYGTWTRRLVAAYGDRSPRLLTAGDLTDLIAEHVVARRRPDERRRSGRSAEENAVGAFRHLWGYLVEKGYATENIAARLTKPPRVESRRRGFHVDEAALLRQLARAGKDPLLDEVTLVLPERIGLRRIELGRVRINDISFAKRTVEVWGKGDKCRTMPIPAELFDLLERYLEDRRPRHLSTSDWRQSSEVLLRRRPTAAFPLGRPTGRRRIEDLFTRLQADAPDVFDAGDLSLHSYRHALGTYVDSRHGRAVARAALGHTSRRSPTDHYVHVTIDQLADVLAEYETHLLGVDRTEPNSLGRTTSTPARMNATTADPSGSQLGGTAPDPTDAGSSSLGPRRFGSWPWVGGDRGRRDQPVRGDAGGSEGRHPSGAQPRRTGR